MTTRPPAASAQARNVLQIAFNRFDEIVSQNDRHVFNNTTLQDVREEALQIERDLRARRMQQNMLRLEPFLKGLERYSKAMEVLCNGTPFLPWVWAPVKLLLLAALDALSAFEKLIEAYGKIAHVLPRLGRFTKAFRYDVNFQNVLALVYSDIIEIHRNSYKLIRRKSWRILFASTWTRFETRFNGILQRLAYHSDLLDKEAVAINISETMRHNEEEMWRWEKEDGELETSKYHTILSWLGIGDPSPEYTLRRHCEHSLPSSSDWFLNQNKMQLWQKDGCENALVWIKGKPGAGKSVLCSNIIRSIEALGVKVLYYFCSYLGDTSDRCALLLRSLAYQIIQKDRDLAIFAHDTYYVSHPKPDTPVMINLMQELLLEIGSTRIVIDGVDEWSDHQYELLTQIRKLMSTDPKAHICKILISSRDTREISQKFPKRNKAIAFSNLSDRFESAAIENSIACFVEARLRNLPSHIDSLDPSGLIMLRLKQRLLEKSNGMFLWVRLVMDSFGSLYSPEDLSNIVDRLHSDLNSLYTQIFEQLCSVAGPESYGGVPRIMSWICYAQRPLHKHELVHGISIGTLDSRNNNRSIPIVDILDHCKPLIEYRPDGTVVFVHFSVKEFLMTRSTLGILSFSQAQLDLSSATVGLVVKGLDLLKPNAGQTDVLIEVASGSYRLLSYAMEFWLEHCLLYAAEVGTADLHRILLEWLSLLETKHDVLIQTLCHKPNLHEAFARNPRIGVDERINLYSHQPAQALMKNIARTQKLVSRNNCENGRDAENFSEQHDPTLFTKLTIEFERYRVILLSHNIVHGISVSALSTFQRTYASCTLRCRFPGCPRVLEGFPSEELRDQHELGHVRRIYCNVESCRYNRIGFKNKTLHDKHDREFHRESRSVIVPRKLRRVDNAQIFRLSLRPKESAFVSGQHTTSRQESPAVPQFPDRPPTRNHGKNPSSRQTPSDPALGSDEPSQWPIRSPQDSIEVTTIPSPMREADESLLRKDPKDTLRKIRELLDRKAAEHGIAPASEDRWSDFLRGWSEGGPSR